MSAQPEPAPEQVKAKVGILFADVYRFTEHMARDPVATRARMRRAEELFKAVVGDYGGDVADIAGDSILAVFRETSRAIQLAVDFQREFENDAVWNDTGSPLRFRIGVHSGDVLADGDKLFGINIIIARRLQELSAPGGVCLSAAARDEAPAEIRDLIRSMGARALKGVPSWFQVYTVEAIRDSAPRIEVTQVLPLRAEVPLSASGDPGVALLPLQNLSSNPADSHLCDGFTSDLITSLSRFRNLSIIARHSAFQFRNAREDELAEIARSLGVRYLATGSLQHAGTKLRVRIKLVDTETEALVWADRLDAALSDVFEVQDEITGTLASKLALKINDAERRRLERHHVPDLSTYGLILRGETLAHAMEAERVLHARRLFEQAASLDPNYGRCYAALARTFNTEWFYGFGDAARDALDRSLELSLTAVDRDPYDARGFSELAYAHLYHRQHESSVAAYVQALDLNPNDADILAEYGDCLIYSGRGEEALSLLNKALRLNPRAPDSYLWHLCDAYDLMQRYDDVIATVKKMRNPALGRRLLAVAYAHLGDVPAARQQAQAILREQPGFRISQWAKRPPYRPNDEAALRFMEGLRLAGLPD
ncbi:MAG: tetratricopeptide repeat protein [Geminicoccaceae bacterium]